MSSNSQVHLDLAIFSTNADLVANLNALEILRETIRILRHHSSPFLTNLFLLICPVSAALLCSTLLTPSLTLALSRRLMLLVTTSGLPLTHLVKQLCGHLAWIIISSVSCFPLLLTILLLAKSSVAYSVACSYAGKQVTASDFVALVQNIWCRLVSTFICVCSLISLCLLLFVAILVSACSSIAAIGYPQDVVVYPALFIVMAFSVTYAYTIIVCNVAGVVSVLEERSGIEALRRSLFLIKGQLQVGLLMFLGSTVAMAFVEGLFEHRVMALSYGDGSSRIWEGPLLVVMYAFVILVDSMMSAVFYLTCRSSSSLEELPQDLKVMSASSSVVDTN